MRWEVDIRLHCLIMSLLCAGACSASISHPPPFPKNRIFIAGVHHSSEVNHASLACESSRPPEALATPDPPIDPLASEGKVAVSFVVGIDGRVHSPVILESAGTAEDDVILQALRLWRYRPGTCNAAPTEMESKVEFSSR